MTSTTPEATGVAATVAGVPVLVSDVDLREERLRANSFDAALPRPGSSEGRQLRRWLTQLLVAERVVAREARELDDAPAPSERDVVPDTVARMELGSVAAAILREPLARSLFAAVTADVVVPEAVVVDYHARNPTRFATAARGADGWQRSAPAAPFEEVRAAIVAHLLAAAKRRAFRRWLDARCAALVELSPGYEHPGDPRQPDNTHRH